MCEAAGIIEVYGLTAAFVAGDAACKAANVRIEAFDRNKPANADSLPVPLVIIIKLRGSVADVAAAVDAAKAAAEGVTGVLSSHIIAAPGDGTEKLLRISAL